MTEQGKTPDAGNVEGLKIANHHKGNHSADALRPLPPGLLQLDPDGAEIFITPINASLTPLGSRYRVSIDLDRSDAAGTWFYVDLGGRICEVYVRGQYLFPRIPMAELHKAFQGLYDGDPLTDCVARTLSDRRQTKTLLTDFAQSLDAADAIREERASRDAICLRFMKLLENPANWVGRIPLDAEIFVGTSTPTREVKN
jgi:hypothetical protein